MSGEHSFLFITQNVFQLHRLRDSCNLFLIGICVAVQNQFCVKILYCCSITIVPIFLHYSPLPHPPPPPTFSPLLHCLHPWVLYTSSLILIYIFKMSYLLPLSFIGQKNPSYSLLYPKCLT